MKPTRSNPGEDEAKDRTHQAGTAFLEEFVTRLEGIQPRGPKSQRTSENRPDGGFTRRKGWYLMNDIRTVACCRDMEIWVPKEGNSPAGSY